MDNSIESINEDMKRIGSLDNILDIYDFQNNNKNNSLLSNYYKPKCLCGFSNLKLIGSGAFSIVFSGYHLLDKNTYALKCIPLPNNKKIIKEKSREILFLSRLVHPNVIRYNNSWLECIPNKIPKFITNNINNIEDIDSNLEIFLFLQMEKVDFTLKHYLEKNNDNTKLFHFNKNIIIQILEGLEYLHSNKVIHCDIKPDNIALINHNDTLIVKIMDFGIASVAGIKNLNYKYYGTQLYTPPEMDLETFIPDVSTDIYSLGILLFEMMYPFKTQSEKIIKITEWKKGKFKTNTILDKMILDNPLDRPTLYEIKNYYNTKT